MAQISYRANLSAAVFPMTLDKAGRSVIVPQSDNNFDRRIDPQGAQKDAGIPQAIYMENVLPTPEGYQSVTVQQFPNPSEGEFGTQMHYLAGDPPVQFNPIRIEPIRIPISTVEIEDEIVTSLAWDAEAVDYAGGVGWETVQDLGYHNSSVPSVFVSYFPGFALNLPYWDARGFQYLKSVTDVVGDPSVVIACNDSLWWSAYAGVRPYVHWEFPDFESAETYDISFTGMVVRPAPDVGPPWTNTADPTTAAFENASAHGIINCIFLGYLGLRLTTGTVAGTTPEPDLDCLQLISYAPPFTPGVPPTVIAQSAPLASPLTLNKYYNFRIQVEKQPFAYNFTLTMRDPVGDVLLLTTAWLGTPPQSLVGTAGSGVGFGMETATLFPSLEPLSAYGMHVSLISAYKDLTVTTTAVPVPVSVTTQRGLKTVNLAFYQDGNYAHSIAQGKIWGASSVVGTHDVNYTSDVEQNLKFSTATVRGNCYTCNKVGGVTKIYRASYAIATLTLTDISADILATLGPSYDFNNIEGIVGSFNYLCLITPSEILWSSTTTPEDFSASLVSGAGGEQLNNLKGDITFAREHAEGFFIYTTGNALFAKYTGNSRYPWKITEIPGSAGFTYPQQIAGDTNSATQIGISNARTLQAMSPQEATTVAAELSTHLERDKHYTTYNTVTEQPVTLRYDQYDAGLRGTLDEEFGVYKIWHKLDRYLIVAYAREAVTHPGLNNQPGFHYTHAMVYDLTLQRYGRIKTNFHQVLSTDSYIFFVNYAPADGVSHYMPLQFDGTSSSGKQHEGVLLLGRFEYLRGKFLTLDEVRLDTAYRDVDYPAAHKLSVLPSIDGKNFLPAVLPSVSSQEEVYPCRVSAQSFCLAVRGNFSLNCVDMKFHLDGNR